MRVEAGARTVEVGVIAIELRVAPVTVKGAVPITPLRVAVMLVVPADTAVAVPPAPIVATEVVWEVHATLAVMTCVVPSLNVPVAVKANLLPGAIERPVGVTVIAVTVALVTVRLTPGGVLVIEPTVAEIEVVPLVSPLARPLLGPMVAKAVLEEVQAACPVKFLVLPSLKVPTAENCCVVFAAICAGSGVTASDAKFDAFTVNEVLPLTAPAVALIVTLPSFSPVASPLTVMEAIVFPVEAQITVPVMSCVVASENVPVAVNCCCTPSGMDMPAGVTAIETSVALLTVSVAVPVVEPVAVVPVAVIVTVPAATPMAVPCVGVVLLIVAFVLSDELHVTLLVTFFTLPSVKVPIAVKEVAVVAAICIEDGLTTSDTNVTGTVKTVDPLIPPEPAEMVVVPLATLVANPPVLMVAVAGIDELQVTAPVRFFELPSE